MTDPTTPGRARIAPGYLLLLLAPILIYFGLEYLLKAFGDGSIDLPADTFADHARFSELTGRFKYMAAVGFFGAVSISVIVIFVLDLWAHYTPFTRFLAFCGLALGGVVGSLFSVFGHSSDWYYSTYHLVGKEFFESALGQGKFSGCAFDQGCGGGFFVYQVLSDPINALTAISAAAAITGLILSLARPAGELGPEEEAETLRASQAVTRRYLYCAGLILTAGMTHLIAWMHWPDALIAEPALREAYRNMIGALTLYIGVGYSVMILSCYLPVMLTHAQRIERFNRRLVLGGTATGVEETRKLEIPQIQYVDALNAVIAILSPILASAIGSFGQGILFP